MFEAQETLDRGPALFQHWRTYRIRDREDSRDEPQAWEKQHAAKVGIPIHDGRITLSPEDRQRMDELHREMEAGKITEASEWGEVIFLEGASADNGLLKSKDRPYWFGSQDVYAYRPHQVDDYLRRTDAILMVIDEKDEKVAHPLAVDIKTGVNRDQANKNIREDLAGALDPRIARMRRIYWYDTFAADAGDALTVPEEGRVAATHVTVFIPKMLCDQFSTRDTPPAAARDILRRLGPLVRLQTRLVLELEAAAILGQRNFDITKLEQGVQRVLAGDFPPDLNPFQRDQLKLLAHQLQTIWRIDRAKHERISPELYGEIPEVLRDLNAALPTPVEKVRR